MKTAYQTRQGFEEWVLPQEFRVEAAELEGALQDGLTAIGSKAVRVMDQQMLEAEGRASPAPKGRAGRAGPASRPPRRHRGVGGAEGRDPPAAAPHRRWQEVPLRNYQGLQQQGPLDEAAFEQTLDGVARRHGTAS